MLTTDAPGAGAPFAAIAGVVSVERREAHYTIGGTGPDLVTSVIDRLSEFRIHVSDFQTEHAGLEDVS